jgi:hypothetical protein
MRLREIVDRIPRRGLAQPVPEAAGTFISLWGTQAKLFATRLKRRDAN